MLSILGEHFPERLEKRIQETNTKDLYFDAITFSRDTLGPLSTIKLYSRLKNNAKALKNVMKNVMKMQMKPTAV